MRPRHQPGPLLIGVVLFIALCTALLATVAALCGGLVYALDDAYIHMAMARNFAEHGVWGVTRHAFTSSSSSPLWTLVLSGCFWWSGARAGWPLVLNLVAGCAVIAVSLKAMRALAPRASRGAALLSIVAIVVFTPLAPLAFTGQEHLLHTALSLAFALAAARAIATTAADDEWAAFDDPGGRVVVMLMLPLLAIAVVAARYEGLFLIAAAALMLLVRGKRPLAWSVALSALVPVAAYAVLSQGQGWFALPNPLLLKGNLADVSRVRTLVAGVAHGDLAAAAPDGAGQALVDVARLCGLTSLEKLVQTPHLLVLVLAAVLLIARRVRAARRARTRGRSGAPGLDAGGTEGYAEGDVCRALLTLFVATALLHLQFARTGWFHRYEAYLVALGVMAIGCTLAAHEHWDLRRPRRLLLTLIVLGPLCARGTTALYQVPRAASNIREQQIQMGSFLAQSYRGASVAVNDVGAVNWLCDLECLDMFGLASLDVCRLRMDLAWHRETIAEVTAAHGVRIAIVYERWFDRESTGGLPASWQRIARWKIAHNIVNGEDTVAFYAVDPEERGPLRDALMMYRTQLPRTVTCTFDPPR